MKLKLLLSLPLLLLVTALPALAQYDTTTLQPGGSNTTHVASPATNTYTGSSVEINTARASQVHVTTQFNYTGAGTANATFVYQWTGDGTNWFELARIMKAGAGATPVSTETNFTVGPRIKLRLRSIENTNELVPITNIVIRATVKNGL